MDFVKVVQEAPSAKTLTGVLLFCGGTTIFWRFADFFLAVLLGRALLIETFRYILKILNSQKTPYISPSRARYRIPIVSILWENWPWSLPLYCISNSYFSGSLPQSRDPGRLFLNNEVQGILRRLTGFDINKIFATRPTSKFGPPKYELMTDEELKMVILLIIPINPCSTEFILGIWVRSGKWACDLFPDFAIKW